MNTYPLNIRDDDKILVIAPHPDDESIGVGGLMALHPEKCDVVVMTDGRYGNPDVEPLRMKKIRKQEFCSAMQMAGVNKYYLEEIEDGKLIEHENVFRKIDYSKYTMIFIPNNNDNHSDHTAACLYTIRSVKETHNNTIRVFMYEVHNPMPSVTCCLDIGCVMKKKQDIISCHTSQMKVHPYNEQVKILAQYRGYQNEQIGKMLEVYAEVDLKNDMIGFAAEELELSKYKMFTKILSNWVAANADHSYIADALLKLNYNKIAIYGYGNLGRLLYNEIKNSKCKVEYIIDKNEKVKEYGISVYHTVENLKPVDVVIVTAVLGYEEIEQMLNEKCALKCVPLDKIILKAKGEA